MTDQKQPSRRDFLATSAKLAAAAGLVSSAGGCSPTDAGPTLRVVQGPRPAPIGADQQVRLGIIGAGNRIFWVTRQMLDIDPNVSIKAVADIHPPHVDRIVEHVAEKLNERPDVYTGTDGYKQLLARDDIDAVLIGTPCHLHAPMFVDCFAAGKHFLGEKPMAITVNEANAVVAAQRKNPEVIAQIGFQRRATTLFPKGIELIRGGALGKLVDARAAWNIRGPIGLPQHAPRDWFGRRRYSGDWMLEQACHTWDVLNWVAGELPVAAMGVGHGNLFPDLDPGRDVTDHYLANIEYRDFNVSFEHSWVCPHHDEYPDAAEGRFSGVFEFVSGMEAGASLTEGKIFYRDREKEPEQYAPRETEPAWTRDMIAAFLKTVRGQQQLICGVETSRMATLVGLLVRKAVYERRRVTMDEITGGTLA